VLLGLHKALEANKASLLKTRTALERIKDKTVKSWVDIIYFISIYKKIT